VAIAALLAAGSGASAAVPPHGRAWELATAGPTNGVVVIGARAVSADGDRVAYASLGPLPGAPSGDLIAHGLATRTASGWTQQAIGERFSLPSADLFASGPLMVSSDLSTWLWSSTQPLLPGAPPAHGVGLYRRDADGSLELLGAVGNRGDFTFVSASDDLQHAVFQSQAHLLPGDAGRTSGGDAYEVAGTQLRLVGVDSAGTAISPCGSEVGSGDVEASRLLHAVSRDGARIFFTAPASGACGQPRSVYLREDGSRTTEISRSVCARADCDAPQDVTFAGALPDGSSAFLITTQQLTSDDVDESADLYRYDVADHALTRISSGPPGTAAAVDGSVVRASDDGTRVYFIASGALAPGATDGTPNLYLSDHGHLRFVATANDIDLRTAQITPDGGTLVFKTAVPLLPSDTDANVDVYRYEAATGALQQISIGAGGRGNGSFDVTFGDNGPIGSLDSGGMRYMSADGRRIFFVTSESLVPEDVNQTPDVYEWVDGVLGLVTSGAGDRTVSYGGVSADGRSAFFTTDETLVPADRNDGDEDLYVARLGGGFPAAAPPPPECEGDACQGPPAGRLVRPQPASVAYGERHARAFRIRSLDRRARGELAAGGGAAIVLDVPASGRVSLVALARLHGRASVVAHAAADVRRAGSVRLELRLSATARRLLRRRGALRLRLVARHSRLGAAPAVALTLRRAA
jgi:Tol biopolymer transport system component